MLQPLIKEDSGSICLNAILIACWCGWNYKRITWLGVLSGILGGFVASVVWLMFFKETWHGLYEAIPGFIAGMALTFGVSRLTYKSSG